MAIEIGGLSWKEMMDMVNRRLDRLAMCKRGTISTEINKKITDIGPRPEWSKADEAAALPTLLKKVEKASKPTPAEIKNFIKCGGYYEDQLFSGAKTRVKKLLKESKEHPGVPKWEAKKAQLKEQETTRIAMLDVDIQTAKDEFALMVRPIEDLPSVLIDLEMREW